MIKDRKPLAETHPHLLKEWDWEKNRGLSPDELHAGSHKKAHWVCKEGHRYFALISNRGVHGSGCPFCAGNRALSGFNDLATVKPKIADQWDHEKNPFPPHSVTSASGKRAWWRCEIGHSWEAVIASRKTSGCPVCAGRAVEIGYNDLQSQRPELASEWDFERNAKGPENFTAGSSLRLIGFVATDIRLLQRLPAVLMEQAVLFVREGEFSQGSTILGAIFQSWQRNGTWSGMQKNQPRYPSVRRVNSSGSALQGIATARRQTIVGTELVVHIALDACRLREKRIS